MPFGSNCSITPCELLARDDNSAIGYGGGQIAVISPAFALERRYGFRIGGLLALDLSAMHLAVRTTAPV